MGIRMVHKNGSRATMSLYPETIWKDRIFTSWHTYKTLGEGSYRAYIGVEVRREWAFAWLADMKGWW